jgi:hypothetical protein
MGFVTSFIALLIQYYTVLLMYQSVAIIYTRVPGRALWAKLTKRPYRQKLYSNSFSRRGAMGVVIEKYA